MIDLLLILLGVALLAAGGEGLMRGALATAAYFQVSPLLSGLVIVGFGTSAPELVVSVDAALEQRPDLALGNVVGSNIGNVLLILAMCALIRPLTVNGLALRRDATTVVLASGMFCLLGADGVIGKVDATILLLSLFVYLTWAYLSERGKTSPPAIVHQAQAKEVTHTPGSAFSTGLAIIGGLALLIVGSQVLLRGATGLALSLGVSEALIGLTLVAIGTSLPEFAISLMATIRRHVDVAVGNVLGSNIFNLFGILGVSGTLQALPVHTRIAQFDQWVLLTSAFLLLGFLISGRRLGRGEAALLLLAYSIYLYVGITLFEI